MDIKQTTKRIEAAYQLLMQDSTTRQKFESIRTLLRGVNPQIDATLSSISAALDDIEKLQKGEVIELSVEHLPEKSEEEKRRKRALLLLIQSWKQLQAEVKRVRGELENLQKDQTPTAQEKVSSFGKMVGFAKGAFGLITLAAFIIVGFQLLVNKPTMQPQVIKKETVQNIEVPANLPLSYWVKESKAELDTSSTQITWSIHVHKEDAGTRQRNQDIPATGAQVLAELRSTQSTIPLSGIVGNDGWVRWKQDVPKLATDIYIMDIKGELPWAQTDQNAWKNKTAASYSPTR